MDKLIANGQHGQTIGIPIGPDTSFIIAEMLLSSVDEAFCDRMIAKQLLVNGYRSFDDFEFGFTTRGDAETAVIVLQEVLAEYELQLNPSKTRIADLPLTLWPNWLSELRCFRLDNPPLSRDLHRYCDRAFELSKLNGDLEVLKYAIRRLRTIDVPASDFGFFQDFLLQCAMVEPSALPVVVDHLHQYKTNGVSIPGTKVGEVLNLLINLHAPLGRGSEVAWALWGCLLFGLPISDASATAVAGMEDSIPAILLLHAQDLGLTRSNLQLQNWRASLTGPGLRGNQWLLSYEANVKGWLSSQTNHVLNDPQFSILKWNDVSFYDVNKVRSHLPSAHQKTQIGVDSIIDY